MTSSKYISIVDYGVGNLHSIARAVTHFTKDVIISEEADEISHASGLILPGVGAFLSGMDGLKIRSLDAVIKTYAQTGKPILGICLGAQMLLSKGYEFGDFDGLNIIQGKVIRFPKLMDKEKIPHVGWNKIYPKEKNLWGNTILDSVSENSNMYFVHSYILVPEKNENVLALTSYGGFEFCSAIRQENIYGCQFHPEKSGEAGMQIIKNFIELI